MGYLPQETEESCNTIESLTEQTHTISGARYFLDTPNLGHEPGRREWPYTHSHKIEVVCDMLANMRTTDIS